MVGQRSWTEDEGVRELLLLLQAVGQGEGGVVVGQGPLVLLLLWVLRWRRWRYLYPIQVVAAQTCSGVHDAVVWRRLLLLRLLLL